MKHIAAWCDHTFNPWIGCTKVSAGTRKRIAYARSVLRELKEFTGDPERCGVMGPEGKESRLQCTRMSHPDTVHRALDMQPMKIVRWRGDKSDEFAKSLIESGLVEMG